MVRPQPGGFNQLRDLARLGVMSQGELVRRGCVRADSPGAGGQAADLSVAQTVVDEGEGLRAAATRPMLRLLRRSAMRCDAAWRNVPPRLLLMASSAAQRTSFEPCFVIDPRLTVVSDSRWRGVNPAQQQSLSAAGNRSMSPISAVKTAHRTRPTPGMAWMAR
jgi:hypothetical protein